MQLRFLPNNQPIAEFSLAVSHKYTTKAGEKREETSFFDLTAFGKQAELIKQYCKKGSALFVECRPKQDTWSDKATGAKRSKIVFVVNDFQFVGGKREGDTTPQEQPQAEAEVPW